LLHEPSLRAKKIRKHGGDTVRVSLACTQGFGMDFDGDEGSIFNACSQNSRADMMELMSTQAQFINGAESKPTLIMKQDNTVGGYLYTKGRVPVSKETFMDVCCLLQNSEYQSVSDKISSIEEVKVLTDVHREELEKLRGKRAELDANIMKFVGRKIEHIRKIHRSVGAHGEEVNRLLGLKSGIEKRLGDLMLELKELKLGMAMKLKSRGRTYDMVKSEARLLRNRIRILEDRGRLDEVASDNLLYTGHSLLSMILPNDCEFGFETKLSPDKKPIQVRRGVILSGTFNNEAIQHLMHTLYKDYGPEFGCDFATYWQRFTNLLLLRQGFSVGLGDCTPKDTELIDTELEKAFLRARVVEDSALDPVAKELKILSILNQATNIGEQIVRRELDPDNNFMHMIVSGAKGKMFNYVQSVSAVGQQNISGRRVPMDCGGRSLPCYPRAEDVVDEEKCKLSSFERNCRWYQSRGFIASSFYDGLESRELFPLAMGGREGLIDTSVKTGKCGYISKRLVKLMEDAKVSYCKTVTNAKGSVIQFSYGYDNYSATELIRTRNYGLQPVDIEHIVERMNADVESM
jgi:DNA-directed RNA polymerase II subunit RPB1